MKRSLSVLGYTGREVALALKPFFFTFEKRSCFLQKFSLNASYDAPVL